MVSDYVPSAASPLNSQHGTLKEVTALFRAGNAVSTGHAGWVSESPVTSSHYSCLTTSWQQKTVNVQELAFIITNVLNQCCHITSMWKKLSLEVFEEYFSAKGWDHVMLSMIWIIQGEDLQSGSRTIKNNSLFYWWKPHIQEYLVKWSTGKKK